MRRIALLIPVYNNQHGLDRSLASIADSDLVDVVVVDDGSAPAVTVPDSVHLIRRETNGGIVAALNDGLRWILERPYKYVARLDAGDTTMRRRFDAQSVYLDGYHECAVVGCYVRHVDEKGNTLFINQPPRNHGRLARYMRRRNGFDHPSVMIRAEALRRVGLYRESARGSEDYDLWLRMLEHGYEIANLPMVYLRKEVTPGQITARRWRSWPRLKVQLRHFDPRQPGCWVGVTRTMFALCTPRVAALRAKQWRQSRWAKTT